MFDSCGGYAFQFLDDITNPPVQLRSIGVEERDSVSYCWHNEKREEQYLFQYTLSGCGFYFDGQRQHRLPPSTAVFLEMPGSTSYYYKEGGPPSRFAYVMLKGSAVSEYYKLICSRDTEVISLADTSKPVMKLENIYRLSLSGKITDPFLATSLAMDFLASLASERSRPGVTLPFLVKQAVDIIEKDYASLDGVEELAERLQISASHLCREFVRALGVGPLACLTRVRLQCAANLLTKTNRKIEDIAIACGFSNGNYFAKVFKKYLGTSPRDFRNNDETDNHNITL